MFNIKHIHLRQIFDSRGMPTVEAEVLLKNSCQGRASSPSGASKGKYEALEKRDKDCQKYFGLGIEKTIELAIHDLVPTLLTTEFTDQEHFDSFLLPEFGSNITIPLSIAFVRASAGAMNLWKFLGTEPKIPKLMINILNGGVHAHNDLDIQEFMIVPDLPLKEALCAGSEIFYSLKQNLKNKGLNTNVGDEGGFAPQMSSSYQALDCIMESIDHAGYRNHVQLALDVAAGELLKNGQYWIDGRYYTSNDLISFYKNLTRSYPIISIEDGFDQDDWEGWTRVTKAIPECYWVGDDLFATQKKRLQEGISKNAANAILIKPNQVGTLTKTLETIDLAKKSGYSIIVSHRSGETEDSFIADFSVSVSARYIKAGSISRGERTAKYNQLLRINEIL